MDRFRTDNQRKIETSHRKAVIPKVPDVPEASLLAGETAIITDSADLSPAIFSAVLSESLTNRARQTLLTDRYIQIRDLWLDFCVALDRYNLATHNTPNVWGNEQHLHPTRSSLAFADDIPQDPDSLFLPGGTLIESPKIGPKWSLHEEKDFCERFFVFGKNFRKIAESMRGKSVKDVTEFYYLKKFSPELARARLFVKRKRVRARRITLKSCVKKGSGRNSAQPLSMREV
jgi:hypothetical protein